MENKLYILTKDYKIGVIKTICNCDKCIKRGEIEVFIDDLEGNYLDCLTISELCNTVIGDEILTCGFSAQEIFDFMKSRIENGNKKCNFLSEINNYLNKIICENKDNR